MKIEHNPCDIPKSLRRKTLLFKKIDGTIYLLYIHAVDLWSYCAKYRKPDGTFEVSNKIRYVPIAGELVGDVTVLPIPWSKLTKKIIRTIICHTEDGSPS
jgi:hypothetical protein